MTEPCKFCLHNPDGLCWAEAENARLRAAIEEATRLNVLNADGVQQLREALSSTSPSEQSASEGEPRPDQQSEGGLATNAPSGHLARTEPDLPPTPSSTSPKEAT